MAAHVRASFTDDDSLSDRVALEMVHLNAPQASTATAVTNNNDLDAQTPLNDSIGTTDGNTPVTNDRRSASNAGLMEGINREYEIPNIFTYKKVISTKQIYFI